jgi:hypothetical protein
MYRSTQPNHPMQVRETSETGKPASSGNGQVRETSKTGKPARPRIAHLAWIRFSIRPTAESDGRPRIYPGPTAESDGKPRIHPRHKPARINGTFKAAEKLIRHKSSIALYQGTTSVVPIRPKDRRGLQPLPNSNRAKLPIFRPLPQPLQPSGTPFANLTPKADASPSPTARAYSSP